MSNPFSELYTEHFNNLLSRHRKLMIENDLEYLLIPSGQPIRIYLDDLDYPFKSSFLFRTYVPLTELPYSYLVVGLTGKPTLIYFQPIDYWHTPPSDPTGFWTEHFDIKVVSQRTEALHFFPKDSAHVAILGESTEHTLRLPKAKINPESLLNAVYWQRAYKSQYEIASLQMANDKAAFAHQVAEQAFRAGNSEQQIHLAYVEAAGVLEHQMPYSNIVALNSNAAVLHYNECKSQTPKQLRSFLIDAGASINGYHADITRTYAYQQDEFADLIQAMDEMQLACINSIEVGQGYLDLHIDAHLKIGAIIEKFGYVNMSPESMLEAGVSQTFFPHGLGHLIGLQVHDIGGQFADASGRPNPPPPSHPFLRSTRQMQAGVAFTVEPGLYFIDSLLAEQRKGANNKAFNWNKIEAMMPYGGIRIEDDIVIQADGVLNLTRDAFAKL